MSSSLWNLKFLWDHHQATPKGHLVIWRQSFIEVWFLKVTGAMRRERSEADLRTYTWKHVPTSDVWGPERKKNHWKRNIMRTRGWSSPPGTETVLSLIPVILSYTWCPLSWPPCSSLGSVEGRKWKQLWGWLKLLYCSRMVFVYTFDIHTTYATAVVPSMGGYFDCGCKLFGCKSPLRTLNSVLQSSHWQLWWLFILHEHTFVIWWLTSFHMRSCFYFSWSKCLEWLLSFCVKACWVGL